MGMLTKFNVRCEVPEAHKNESWPFFFVVRPELGEIVVSVEKTELRVVTLKHAVQQEIIDGEANQTPYLIVVLE